MGDLGTQYFLGNTEIINSFVGDKPVLFNPINFGLGGYPIYQTGSLVIVAALEDIVDTSGQFGCANVYLGTSSSLFTADLNQQYILNNCADRPIISSLADSFVHNGYNDWLVPTKDELDILYNYRTVLGMYEGYLDGFYCSSTDDTFTIVGDYTFWGIVYNAGPQQSRRRKQSVTDPNRIRCIRYATI